METLPPDAVALDARCSSVVWNVWAKSSQKIVSEGALPTRTGPPVSGDGQATLPEEDTRHALPESWKGPRLHITSSMQLVRYWA
ncbi:hypothetical protein Ct61P_06203 [Colletotrichum tofieldiae]|nr:hypothetical protein Ct61P_06203 [Colletotrichum tofieldiae]